MEFPLPGLSGWLMKWRSDPSQVLLDQGLKMAHDRSARMRSLIQSDPGLAVDSMLSFQDYRDLPEELAEVIEKPFAVVGKVDAISTCFPDEGDLPEHSLERIQYHAVWGSSDRRLFLPEERMGLMTKSDFPMTGIELEDLAALHREPCLLLGGAERLAAEDLFFGSRSVPDPGSRLLIGDNMLAAFSFEETESLKESLIYAEKQIGPNTVSMVMAAYQAGSREQEVLTQSVHQSTEAWTTGEKKVLLIRLALPGQKNVVREKASYEKWLKIVSDQFENMSYGKTRFSIMEVTDKVYLLPLDAKTYSGLEVRRLFLWTLHVDAAKLVAKDGIKVADYDLVVLVTPSMHTRANGKGTVGGGKLWFFDSEPGYGYTTMRHELGHNYGLRHASAWDAKDGSVMPDHPSDKYHREYGDRYDHMGSSGTDEGEFNVFERNRLKWVDDSCIEYLDTKSNGIYRVYRFDHPNALENPTLALKIQFRASEPFWIMYRKKFVNNASLNAGAYLLWQYDTARARMLDMVPELHRFDYSNANDEALTLGNTFTDPTELVRITPIAVGGDEGNEWLDIRVEIGHRNPPSLSLTAPIESVSGTAMELTASGLDSGPDEILYRWDFGDGSTAATRSASVEHVYEQPGTYSVHVFARSQLHGVVSETFVLEVASQPASGYEAWLSRDFSLSTQGEALLPKNDYDGDGFTNILEYGLGLDPTVSDAAQFLNTQLLRIACGEKIEVGCRSNDADLEVVLYVSRDLEIWSQARLSNAGPQQGFDDSDLIRAIQLSEGDEGFQQVKIELPTEAAPLFIQFGASYRTADI